MAISFYTGIPRSGKSYKAVALIYNLFVDKEPNKLDSLLTKVKLKSEKKEDYINCYTNINQFNFDISPDIIKLDFEELQTKLTILYALYMEKNPDDVLIEKAKELNIFKSLFVIDECHNYLKSKENNVLVWWFTYHGHLYQDIILITQDLKLVNDEYKRVAEFFYKAVPQRLRFSKGTFKYRQYSSWQMYQKDYISTESLKANDKVFSMYVSGATVHTKPIIYKYLIIFFILILFVLYFFNDFLNSFEPPKKEEPKKEQIETNINQTQSIQQPINQTTQQPNNQNNQSILDNTKIEEDTTNLKLYKFNCFKDFCYYKQDKQITIEIPMPFLIAISKDMDKSNKYMLFEKNRTVIYLLANEEKFNFIKGVQNENKEDGNSLMPTVGIPN